MSQRHHRLGWLLVVALAGAFPHDAACVRVAREGGAELAGDEGLPTPLFSGRLAARHRKLLASSPWHRDRRPADDEPASTPECRLVAGDNGEPATIVPTQWFGEVQSPKPAVVAAMQVSEPLPPQPLPADALPPASTSTATDTASATPASGEVRLTPIGQLSSGIAPSAGELPHDYAADALATTLAQPGDTPGPIRTGAPFYSTPRAADFTHRPLYFEERGLERNGRNYGLAQPVVSGLHFFGTLPVLPYKMGAQPPSRRITTGNGVDIPGDRLTRRDRLRGLATEAGTATGLILVIP